MDVFPKYILVELEGVLTLIFSMVKYHKDLVSELIDVEKDKIKGGGWFRYNEKTNTFIFHDDSHDFGRAKQEDVQLAIDNGQVFGDKWMYENITNEYNFSYDTQCEIIELKKLEA